MDGNPQPYAEFKWSHLSSSSARNVTAIPMYPFVYTATYSLHNIDWSYCGRMLQITVKNRIGSSSVRSTNVTVLCKLNYRVTHYLFIDVVQFIDLCRQQDLGRIKIESARK